MTTHELQAVADGKVVIDSTQAPQIARELIAARALIVFLEEAAENFGDIRLGADTEGLMLNALVMYQLERDAAREAE